MADQIYQAFARVFGSVLPVVGVGALLGGGFAHKFVAQQLKAEDITMPDAAAIAPVSTSRSAVNSRSTSASSRLAAIANGDNRAACSTSSL